MKKLKLEPKFCVICDKELTHEQSRLNRNTCGKECGYIYSGLKLSGRSTVKKIPLKCAYCGSDFKVYPSAVKIYSTRKHIRKYCTKVCEGLDRTGENNSNYKEFAPQFCIICNKQLTKKQIILKVKTCSYKCGYANRDQKGEKGSTWKDVDPMSCPICNKSLTHSQIISNHKTCGSVCGYKLASKTMEKRCNTPKAIFKMSDRMKKLWKTEEFQKKMAKSTWIRPTKPEKYIINVLNKLFPNEYKYVGDFQFFLGGKNPDFMNINGQKKLIEMFGDYWHKDENPKHRIDHFKRYGFDTLVIWQKELKNERVLIDTLKNFHNK